MNSPLYCKILFFRVSKTIFSFCLQWNNKGYDVAKSWAPKFNYISPVWLQIKRQSPNIYIISGLHDVDHAWMKSVRQKGSGSNLKSMYVYILTLITVLVR